MPPKSNFCYLVSISLAFKTLIQLAVWYPIYKLPQINALDLPVQLLSAFF